MSEPQINANSPNQTTKTSSSCLFVFIGGLKKTSASVLVLVLMLGVGLSCKLSERFFGDKNAGTVSSLWPDVPPFEGATKVDIDLPLPARFLFRTMTRGKASFISFRTDKSQQDVKNFYTKGRMIAAGWTPGEKDCFADSQDTKNRGTMCLYTRKDEGKQETLAIVIAHNEKPPDTNIFYVRIDTTNMK